MRGPLARPGRQVACSGITLVVCCIPAHLEELHPLLIDASARGGHGTCMIQTPWWHLIKCRGRVRAASLITHIALWHLHVQPQIKAYVAPCDCGCILPYLECFIVVAAIAEASAM